MNKIVESATLYRSFEEFQRRFYPVWYESQESHGTQQSFGKDLARYSLEKHFPLPIGSENTPRMVKKLERLEMA